MVAFDFNKQIFQIRSGACLNAFVASVASDLRVEWSKPLYNRSDPNIIGCLYFEGVDWLTLWGEYISKSVPKTQNAT